MGVDAVEGVADVHCLCDGQDDAVKPRAAGARHCCRLVVVQAVKQAGLIEDTTGGRNTNN